MTPDVHEYHYSLRLPLTTMRVMIWFDKRRTLSVRIVPPHSHNNTIFILLQYCNFPLIITIDDSYRYYLANEYPHQSQISISDRTTASIVLLAMNTTTKDDTWCHKLTTPFLYALIYYQPPIVQKTPQTTIQSSSPSKYYRPYSWLLLSTTHRWSTASIKTLSQFYILDNSLHVRYIHSSLGALRIIFIISQKYISYTTSHLSIHSYN